MARKKRKKHTRIGYVSNIKINNKVLLIFAFLIISIAIMSYSATEIVISLNKENKRESEKMISAAAEEYLNTEIENMVSVAKSVYTNEALYDFLNTRYQSTVDYFDRYYDFSQSRVLVVTEDSAIKQFKIYTANDTVMNGGNIGRLDSVSSEQWYRKFKNLNRDMALFCSSDQKNLFLIRKLDYKRVQTGESLIKIDFNTSNLQNRFKNMYFDGFVFVTSDDDTLLYSNMKDMILPKSGVLSDNYMKKSKNYYTCDINYYVLANPKNPVSLISPTYAVPLVILFILCFVFVVVIITDFKNRTQEVCNICTDKRIGKKVQFGEDEIGKLYRDVNNTIIDISRLNDEKQNLKRFLNDYKVKTNDVIIGALNYETRIRFGIESNAEVSEVISLSEELINISKMLDELKKECGFRYSLLSDTESTEKTIIPYSLSAIALHIAKYEGTDHDVEIDVREHDGCYSIRYYKQGVAFSSADILKLRAIFEPESAKSLPAFDAEDEYNSYIRLSRFYLDDITFNINTKEEIDFEFIITNNADRKEKEVK